RIRPAFIQPGMNHDRVGGFQGGPTQGVPLGGRFLHWLRSRLPSLELSLFAEVVYRSFYAVLEAHLWLPAQQPLGLGIVSDRSHHLSGPRVLVLDLQLVPLSAD